VNDLILILKLVMENERHARKKKSKEERYRERYRSGGGRGTVVLGVASQKKRRCPRTPFKTNEADTGGSVKGSAQK